ncbi:MAG TPA: F0F1 ATP synthase subunit A [Bacteroidales bacterium]|jgi:F-type H+-transporting ATPase subunit a|nr:F0F1 ATP synthase subunit A [Bacteroidales bacterium]MBP7874052.1 F0F1 ATP synthase subunit A [Bacteroidales bacterium]MCZ2281770.1 F0F1 ATP synthase subunit A [Bacteroidales bacterium]HPX33655.1 F0F1 ATP synthase subunit A [Bacteroidales bacterium]
MSKKFKRVIIPIGIVLILFLGNVFSADGSKQQTEIEQQEDTSYNKKAFDPSKMIFHHIADAHDWHVMDIGDFHFSIPLPIILWHEGKLHVFMSNKLKHGNALYKGFGLATEASTSKIVYADIDKFNENHQIIQDLKHAAPLDFSITKNVVAIFVSSAIMLWVFISVANAYRKRGMVAPGGLQSFLEPVILFVRDDIAKPSIGEKKYKYFMPFLLTIFFFIFLNNVMGLIPIFPGGANVTGNIAVTLVLAAFTLITIILSANKDYWKHIFNTPGVPWILKIPIPLMPVIELLGLIIKPIVLMIRLFANITAGHIIGLAFVSLIFIFGNTDTFLGFAISPVSVVFSIFIKFIELLVAFIQAYVFTLLSALYIGLAVEEAHH